MATMKMLEEVKAKANAKGEETMAKTVNTTTTTEKIAVTINTNTEKQGYEIRFSGVPKASIKNMLIALKFRFYPALANAWIKKSAKVTDTELKDFTKACEKAGYTVSRTVDGKAETPKEEPTPKADGDMMAAMIEFLKAQGYAVTKEEPKAEPKPKAKKSTTKAKAETKTESKPKAEKKSETKKTAPKLEAKAEVKSNNTKKPKATRKLFVDGVEIFRDKPTTEVETTDFPF